MQFKSVLNRKITGRAKNARGALDLLCEGISACVEAGGDKGAPSAADLAVQLTVIFESFNMAHDDESIHFMEAVSNAFLLGTTVQPERIAALPDVHNVHKLFLHRCFAWSRDKKTAQGRVTAAAGEFLHTRLAKLYIAEAQGSPTAGHGALWKAYKHLVNTRHNVSELVGVVATLTASDSASQQQWDLFVVRAFLQIACRVRPFADESPAASRTAALTSADSFLATSCTRMPQMLVANSAPINFSRALSTLLHHANGHSGGEASSAAFTANTAAVSAVDALLDVYLPIINARDAKLGELIVAVVQEHRATAKHIKKASGLGGLLGALLGGGAGMS